MKRVIVPFPISHQGCPHTCVFCDQRIISGASGRLPSGDEIITKIEEWGRSSPGRPLEVAFYGGTFTALPIADQQQLLEPVQPLIARGVVHSIRLSTRPDAIDAGTVARLAGQGVGTIELGIQSMDDRVLEASGRGHSAAQSASAISCIKEGGLSVGAQLMPGLPGDSTPSARDSLRRVIAAGADFLRLYPVVVLRGTELARLTMSGAYRPLSVEEGVAICKALLLDALKADINVIRIGLQADEGLNSHTILAGCWHPALGQLVYGELFHDLLVRLVAGRPQVTVGCHPRYLATLIGQGRSTIRRLNAAGSVVTRVTPDSGLRPLEIRVSGEGLDVSGTITDLWSRDY